VSDDEHERTRARLAPVGQLLWVGRAISFDCVDAAGATIASHSTAAGIDAAPMPTARAVYVTTTDGIAIVATDASCPGA